MLFNFGRKERTKEKSIGCSPANHLGSGFLWSYIREATLLSCVACLAQSQRRLLLPVSAAHAFYNLISFRDSANGVFLFRQFTPAPCSPPLGGSDGDSAVRFTPAGKYGGRENWQSGRETRCMSGHPCRAHHKLKWARKGQSGLEVLYELIPRSESSKTIIAVKLRCPPMIRRLPKLRRVNPVRQGLATTP